MIYKKTIDVECTPHDKLIFFHFRAQRTLKAASEVQSENTIVTGNPFKPRPSSSRAASAAANVLEKALSELDSEQHMPENIDIDTWRKLISLRRTKVGREQQVNVY